MAWDIGAFENVSAAGAGTASFVGGSSVSALGAQTTPSNAGYIGSNPILKKYIGANLVWVNPTDPPVVNPAVASFIGGSALTANQLDLPISGDILPITQVRTGFTQVNLAADSRVIYVSQSTGLDGNDGLTTSTPLKTIAVGLTKLRHGYPDWLCLKAGDTWHEDFGQWKISGRSVAEPMVVTSYGVGTARPLLINEYALVTNGGGGSPPSIDYLVIYGIHFYNETRDLDSPNYVANNPGYAISWLMGTQYLLLEDNMFQHYVYNVSIDDFGDVGISNVKIRRNIIIDASPYDQHSQGIYLSDMALGCEVVENVFDHNGWYAPADRTIYNHGMYLQYNSENMDIKDNIVSRSSSHGVQLRSGGDMINNFVIYNAIGLLIGSNDGSDSASGKMNNNVLIHGDDITALDRRGWGIDFADGYVVPPTECNDNVIVHVATDYGGAFAVYDDADVTYLNNRIWNWNSDDSGKNYVDPGRTIETYSTSVGGAGTFADFIAKCRAQGMRSGWDTDYDVSSINPYFVAGVQDV